MTRMKLLFAAFVVAAVAATVPAANAAPTLHFAASGSSAMYQGFGISTVNDIANNSSTCAGGVGTSCKIHHFTIKGTACADSVLAGTPCVGVSDSRSGAIPPETATFWAVWVCPLPGDCNGSNATDVWLYDQVDSTVGVRTFLGQAKTVVATGVQSGADPSIDNINPALLKFGVSTGTAGCAGHTTCDDPTIPADVYTAMNNSILNTGMTDIRPEDALFATERANSTSTLSPWSGLGYGSSPTQQVGAGIVSSFSTVAATPVAFGLPGGTDPFTGTSVPNSITVFPVGESPILFITNRSNASGLGVQVGGKPWYNNAGDNVGTGPAAYVQSPIGALFGGTTCSGSSTGIGNFASGVFTAGLPSGTSDFAVNPILRESLSGTMNTTEFSSFRTFGGSLAAVGGSEVSNSNVSVTTSQEAHLVASAGAAPLNPLNSPCTTNGGSGLGTRRRAVGTGEEVGKPGGTGVGGNADSIGYAFFSFGNVKSLGNLANYGYLMLDGVDPIFNSYAGGDPGQPAAAQGLLPLCDPTKNGTVGAGCETTDVWTGGNSFPHLRDGTYRAWSLLRAICDTNAADAPNFGAGHCTKAQDPLGTEGLIAATQDDIHNNNNEQVADFLPFSDDNSFGPSGGFGDAKFIRSHYAFNSAVGAGKDASPSTHITPSFSILPNGLNPDQANGTGGNPEAGGDAGGCIVAIETGGSLAKGLSSGTTSVVNAGTKMKFNYTALGISSGALKGICGPASPAGFAGQSCVSSFDFAENSNTDVGAIAGTNCGAAGAVNPGATCNPPATGMSVAVTGFTGANNVDNGVFQVTRILFDGQIKVRVQPTSSTTTASQAGVTLSANNGCSQ